jgi:hypothetical protein
MLESGGRDISRNWEFLFDMLDGLYLSRGGHFKQGYEE